MNISDQKEKTLFSGIKPSGELHLGNYIGAISQWLSLQEEYNCIFCIVDYHAITVKQDPKILKQRIQEIAKIYLASGIDPERSTIFLQSDINEHTELAWLLNCASARTGDLNKMIQFKEKTGSKKEGASVGLYDYPVLMAADILIYDADMVPVGEDQVQHVELTRTLAKRFNKDYGEIFKIPEVLIKKEGARIMGLEDPSQKMSKSIGGEANCIFLLDNPKQAAKKIKRATTDSGTGIKYDKKNKPGISNLLSIYSILEKRSIKKLEKQYQDKGYKEFKEDLSRIVEDFLTEFQNKYKQTSNKMVKDVLRSGAERLRPLGKKKLEKTKKKLGTYLK